MNRLTFAVSGLLLVGACGPDGPVSEECCSNPGQALEPRPGAHEGPRLPPALLAEDESPVRSAEPVADEEE